MRADGGVLIEPRRLESEQTLDIGINAVSMETIRTDPHIDAARGRCQRNGGEVERAVALVTLVTVEGRRLTACGDGAGIGGMRIGRTLPLPRVFCAASHEISSQPHIQSAL